MTPKGFIQEELGEFKDILTDSYVIRMDEQELYHWMSQYADHEKLYLVKGIEWLKQELQNIPGTENLQGHCASLLNLSQPIPF